MGEFSISKLINKEVSLESYNKKIVDLTEYIGVYAKDVIYDNNTNLSLQQSYNIEVLLYREINKEVKLGDYVYSINTSKEDDTKLYFVYKPKSEAWLKDDFIVSKEIVIVEV